MKKLFLLFILSGLYVSSFSQQVITNAENIGTSWYPIASCCIDYWNNPLKDAVNSTDKAITVWINNGDPAWTGGGMGGLNIDVQAYNTISVMVYKLIAGDVQLELKDEVNPNAYLHQNYTTPGSWQKLEYTIPANMGNIKVIGVSPHFADYSVNPIPDDNMEKHRMWWDEIVAFHKTTTDVPKAFNSAEVVKTEIYSSTGSLIETIQGDFVKSSNTKMKNGLYILKKTDKNGNVLKEKIILK